LIEEQKKERERISKNQWQAKAKKEMKAIYTRFLKETANNNNAKPAYEVRNGEGGERITIARSVDGSVRKTEKDLFSSDGEKIDTMFEYEGYINTEEHKGFVRVIVTHRIVRVPWLQITTKYTDYNVRVLKEDGSVYDIIDVSNHDTYAREYKYAEYLFPKRLIDKFEKRIKEKDPEAVAEEEK